MNPIILFIVKVVSVLLSIICVIFIVGIVIYYLARLIAPKRLLSLENIMRDKGVIKYASTNRKVYKGKKP